jgi:uncharacterized membrane protein YgcG
LVALYTVVVTPLNGSSGTFTFACDSLPTDALCSFNPVTEKLNAGTTGNVTVNVSTGTTTSAVLRRIGSWGAIPLLCGLLVLPLIGKRRRLLHAAALLALMGVLAGGVASCTKSGGGTGGGGGSGSGSGGGGATPAGTYSIPITVTSTGVSHSVTVTLTVD